MWKVNLNKEAKTECCGKKSEGIKITTIHASWVYAFTGDEPTVLTNHDVVLVNDRIEEIVPCYKGHADLEIDATGKVVIPGLINLHTHASPAQHGTTVDLSVVSKAHQKHPEHPLDTVFLYSLFFPLRNLFGSKLSKEERAAFLKLGLMALIRGGATTVVEHCGLGADIFAEIAMEMGARVYVGKSYTSLQRMPILYSGQILYEEEVKNPFFGLEQGIELHKRYHGAGQDRVRVMLTPHATETCSPEVLRATREAADKLGCGVHIHLAQSKAEVERIRKGYNQTPVEYLHELGILGPDCLAAHCVYTDEKDWNLLSKTNTTQVHCATTFSKGGVSLPLKPFVENGINVGLGTDSFHTDYIIELRTTALQGKLIEQSPWAATAGDVLAYATLNGAKALNRTDLGRISPGAKADLLIVDLSGLHNAPVLEPLRNLVYLSSQADIDTVIIDGQVIVRGGHFKNIDEKEALKAAQPVFDKLWGLAEEEGLITR